MNHFRYENLDETFGVTAPEHEGDADVIHEYAHEHSWVTDRIAVGGGIWRREEVLLLAKEGITHVIDCRSSGSAGALYKDTGVTFFHCGTDDDGQPKGDEWFGPGAMYGVTTLAMENTKLLVHCLAGINRGPSMAYVVMRLTGFDENSAYSAIKMARHLAVVGYREDAEKWIDGR